MEKCPAHRTEYVSENRLPWRETNSARVRSLIYALDTRADERVVAAGVNTIGSEAEDAFRENLD